MASHLPSDPDLSVNGFFLNLEYFLTLRRRQASGTGRAVLSGAPLAVSPRALSGGAGAPPPDQRLPCGPLVRACPVVPAVPSAETGSRHPPVC